MMPKSIISSKLISLSFVTSSFLWTSCSKVPKDANPSIPQAEVSKDQDTGEMEDAESGYRRGELKIYFKNDRAALEYTIDPNDEDLYIQMDGGQARSKEVPSQKPTPQAPINITQTVQNPANSPSQAPSQPKEDFAEQLKRQLEEEAPADSSAGLPKEDATDRVLSDIRKAQKALYNNDLGKAEKLVRNSLGIRETAEGFALLGTIHYMRKDNPRAMDAWNRSLILDPSNQQIQTMINKVQGTP